MTDAEQLEYNPETEVIKRNMPCLEESSFTNLESKGYRGNLTFSFLHLHHNVWHTTDTQ